MHEYDNYVLKITIYKNKKCALNRYNDYKNDYWLMFAYIVYLVKILSISSAVQFFSETFSC